jgi:RpiR family carbohydrate utilization transcriptional regulator
MSTKSSVVQTIREHYPELYDAEKKVADTILDDPALVMTASVSQIAKKSNVSDATVVRMCQHIGYDGYYQMRIMMSHSLGNSDTHKRPNPNSDPVGYVIGEETAYLKILDMAQNKSRTQSIAQMLCNARKVIVVASGNTVPVAMDFSFRLNRFSICAFTSSITEYCVNYISNCGEDDVLVAISKSGESTRVLRVIDFAKKRKMKIVAMTGNDDSKIAALADCMVNSGAATLFADIQHGVETHVGEMAMVDAILYAISNKVAANMNEDAEVANAAWKI